MIYHDGTSWQIIKKCFNNHRSRSQSFMIYYYVQNTNEGGHVQLMYNLRPPHQVLINFTYIVRFRLVDQDWLVVA